MAQLITTLRDETRLLLICRDPSLTIAEIAKAIDSSPQWLNQFARGSIPNPGVNTVETLNAFLKSKGKNV